MQKKFLIVAATAGLTAVILGAFGAHALRALLDTYQQNIWDKGVQYQIYHALAIFACAMYLRNEPSALIRNAAVCFSLGIVCFSGSLYLLATHQLTQIPVIILGPVTPVGGLLFIAGWGFVLLQAIKSE